MMSLLLSGPLAKIPSGGAGITAPTFVAIGSFQASFGGISLTAPAHVANDVGVVVYGGRGSDVPATPSGWTALGTVGTLSGTDPLLQVFWRRAASSADLDVAIADAGNHNHGAVLVFRGCPTGSAPIALLGSGNTQTATTAASITGQTSTQNNSLIMGVLSHSFDSATPDLSGGFTNGDLTSITTRFSDATDAGSGNGLYGFTGLKATAGAFGATTATLSNAGVGLANAHFEIYGV